MSWDAVMDGGGVTGDGSGSGSSGTSADSGGSFFYPEGGGRDYVSTKLLKKYGDWVKDSDSGWERAGKAAFGVVIVPIGAYLSCGEHTVRSPGL